MEKEAGRPPQFKTTCVEDLQTCFGVKAQRGLDVPSDPKVVKSEGFLMISLKRRRI